MILQHNTKEEVPLKLCLLRFSLSIHELCKTIQRLREISNSLLNRKPKFTPKPNHTRKKQRLTRLQRRAKRQRR